MEVRGEVSLSIFILGCHRNTEGLEDGKRHLTVAAAGRAQLPGPLGQQCQCFTAVPAARTLLKG